MQPSERKRREILRAFYALIGIVAVSVTLVAVSLFFGRAEERALRERLEQFHLNSIVQTFEASRQASIFQLELVALTPPSSAESDPGDRLAADRSLRSALLTVGTALDSIVALSDEWRQPANPMADTLTRLSRQYHDVRDEWSEEPRTIAELSSKVAAVKFTLFQLDRLHSIAAQELLARIETTGRRNTQRTALLSGIVLLVAGLTVARILFMLRGRLREHERTEQMLLERERQLRQSAKLEALGSLVGGVAHDFNNLLTAILGHTEVLLSETDLTDSNRNTLGEIRKAGERATGLTRQLLVFSRQQAVEPRVVDLNLMIQDLKPMLRRLIREDISLDFNLEPGAGNAEIDPVQIEQVIVNLAVNARDAMADGGVLSIQTSNVEIDAADPSVTVPGSYVRIRVEDTGCGMPPETLSRAFDPFFTTKEQGKGTGLGLATVHGIATKAGGHVRAQSQVGAGTRFDVHLPWSGKQPLEHSAGAEHKPMSGGTETVLVAEDEPQIRGLIVQTLRAAGYHVLEAKDGDEALRVCAEHPGQVQLILSDVVMPGMRGPEMVQQAREYQPSARVLYLSGYAENDVHKDGWSPDDPLLTKPFKLQLLRERVRQELDAGRVQDAAATCDTGPTAHRR